LGTLIDPDNHRKAFAKLTEKAGIGRWHPHVNADRNGERVPVEKGSTSVRSYLAA
jgi:hypothetical protein